MGEACVGGWVGVLCRPAKPARRTPQPCLLHARRESEAPRLRKVLVGPVGEREVARQPLLRPPAVALAAGEQRCG